MNHPLNFGGADLPRDFSVYYIAAWRMFHNPSQIFTPRSLSDGEPAIYPSLTPYKYLPSFLILVSPLASLSYYQAFWIFDAVQFALLPLIALLLYKLLEKKNPIAAFAILVAVVLLPYPMLGKGLSVSYFMSWAEGQAKILLTFLLLLSYFLGFKGRAKLSGILYALSAFDPRFAFLGLPLFIFYNRYKLKASIVPMAAALVVFNFALLYPGVTQGFLNMVLSSGTSTPFFTPSLIPMVMILCLLAVNGEQMADELEARYPSLRRYDFRVRKTNSMNR